MDSHDALGLPTRFANGEPVFTLGQLGIMAELAESKREQRGE
jgi:hypothetical protein